MIDLNLVIILTYAIIATGVEFFLGSMGAAVAFLVVSKSFLSHLTP